MFGNVSSFYAWAAFLTAKPKHKLDILPLYCHICIHFWIILRVTWLIIQYLVGGLRKTLFIFSNVHYCAFSVARHYESSWKRKTFTDKPNGTYACMYMIETNLKQPYVTQLPSLQRSCILSISFWYCLYFSWFYDLI